MRPDDKLARVRELQSEGNCVATIGTGQRCPVLAGADVSIAMGQGAQLVHASVPTWSSRPSDWRYWPRVHKARATRAVIKQRPAWAILYNLSAVPWRRPVWWHRGWPRWDVAFQLTGRRIQCAEG